MRTGWLQKHRQRRPAVVVAFVARETVEGDPNAWMALTKQLDAVRAAAAAGSCRLAVVVVGDDAMGDDRAGAIRRQAQIDPRCLITMPQPPTPASLARVAKLCQDLAHEYYGGECARQAAKASSAVHSIAAVKPGFKAAAFAEFHGDWAGALRLYRAAYGYLLTAHAAAETCPGGYSTAGVVAASPLGPRPVQDRFERLAIAEQLHYKLCALLLMLHPGQPAEAVEQMRAHMSTYKRLPPGGSGLPRAALPMHWRWVARQYHAFAELLAARVPWGAGGAKGAAGSASGGIGSNGGGEDGVSGSGGSSGGAGVGTAAAAAAATVAASLPPPGTPRTHLPGFYYHAAATATEERRRTSEAVAAAAEEAGGDAPSAGSVLGAAGAAGVQGVPKAPVVAVAEGAHVGTLRRVGAAPSDVRLKDAEYLRHLYLSSAAGPGPGSTGGGGGGAGVPLIRATIELLTKAHEHFKRTVLPGSSGSARLFASLVSQLAAGYLGAGDFAAARRLLASVALVYRREVRLRIYGSRSWVRSWMLTVQARYTYVSGCPAENPARKSEVKSKSGNNCALICPCSVVLSGDPAGRWPRAR